MFTDIVDSTSRAAALGDRRWSELLEDHHRLIRQQLPRFGGLEVKTIGDGFLATFDGPARAVRCALAAIEANREIGVILRAGLHTGECERRGEDIAGIGVHIGARVAALAGSGEVLVSRTREGPRRRLGPSVRGPRQPCPEGRPGRLAAVRRQLVDGRSSAADASSAAVSSRVTSTSKSTSSVCVSQLTSAGRSAALPA